MRTHRPREKIHVGYQIFNRLLHYLIVSINLFKALGGCIAYPSGLTLVLFDHLERVAHMALSFLKVEVWHRLSKSRVQFSSSDTY
jgi:hypothetical protein